MDPKPPRRLIEYSAGTMIFDLTAEAERVALVLNMLSTEVKWVRKDQLVGSDKKRVLEERGDGYVVEFDQAEGFGGPFGKEELEDGRDRKVTALRETLEETGFDAAPYIIPDVFYREQPDRYAHYSNTVFLVNGCKFQIRRDAIRDSLVDPVQSGFKLLRELPIKKDPDSAHERKFRVEWRTGIYQATLRRIIATLIQLDAPLLRELGRDGLASSDELVWLVVQQTRYTHFFSYRMCKMLFEMGRPDFLLVRLRTGEGKIRQLTLARQIARNCVFFFEDEELLNKALSALMGRISGDIKREVTNFLVFCYDRKQSLTASIIDRKEIEQAYDDHVVVDAPHDDPGADEETPDFVRLWMGDKAEDLKGKLPKTKTGRR